jgi:transposase-like protein
MARRSFTDEQRAEALALYAEVGAAEAARRTGIAAGTIQSWASRSGVATACNERTAAAVEAAQQQWAQRRVAMVHEMGRVAAKALRVAENNLDAGSANKAKDAATTMAILVDKAQLLGGDATARHESRELRNQLLEQARSHSTGLRAVS